MNSAVNDVPYSILKAYVETKSTVTRLLTAVATTKRIQLFFSHPICFSFCSVFCTSYNVACKHGRCYTAHSFWNRADIRSLLLYLLIIYITAHITVFVNVNSYIHHNSSFFYHICSNKFCFSCTGNDNICVPTFFFQIFCSCMTYRDRCMIF